MKLLRFAVIFVLMALSIVAFAQLLGRNVAFGQGPSFEAESVKASAPMAGGRIRIGFSGGPGTSDPGRIELFGITLKTALTRAYGAKDHQVEGPGWIATERYDIVATIPPGTGEEPFRLMLQGLLADRFHMVVRRETRQIAVYAITVGKDAPKLKAAADDGIATRFGPGETGRQLKGNLTLTQVANLVSTTTDRPVVDFTGLPGKFEIDLNWVPDESDQTASMLSAEAAASGARKAGAPGTQDNIGPTLARVLQDKLGLKLDSRKNPTEVIVVERAEKVPKAN